MQGPAESDETYAAQFAAAVVAPLTEALAGPLSPPAPGAPSAARPQVRQAIVIGTLVPLLMFLAWEAAILGNTTGVLSSGMDPVAALQAQKPALAPAVDAFSFLAVATSTIGFVLGLSDFIADGLSLEAGRQQPIPYAVTILPPYVLALSFPGIFFSALDAAGTYGVLVLFGLMPALMVWNERYAGVLPPAANIRIVPGGRATLLLVGGAALAVILNSFLTSLQGPN